MKSIRARLLAALLAIFAVAALAMGGVTYTEVLAQTEALFDYQLRQMALSLRDQGEIAPDQAGAFADEQLDFVVQIWTVDGRSIYASRPHAALPTRALLGWADMNVEGQAWRAFSVATTQRVIQVAQPRQIRSRLAARAALRSVLPLAAIAPLLAIAAGWLVSRALAPLRRVAADVRSRDGQSLAPLVESGLPDEVAPLVQSLNALLGRLGASLGAQRAFVSDAAHELRSPLTALKLQLRVLEKAGDEAGRDEARGELAAGIDRASRLVEQLLTLARSEPGAAKAALQPVDLAEIARRALVDPAAAALARGSEFELFADAPVIVQGDAPALAALVRNLADNAVRHSPPGARIEVRAFVEPDADAAAVLRVDDSGPGIPAGERDRVFDRFHRRVGETSDAEGTGLGLAIVRSVAERHGARVALDGSPLGGLRATVAFRKSRAAAS